MAVKPEIRSACHAYINQIDDPDLLDMLHSTLRACMNPQEWRVDVKLRRRRPARKASR